MSKGSGSVIGGMLLTAGSCIGAGMLGLPIMTGFAGFFPSLLMFFVAWAFMTTTALLLVEINGWFSKQVNLLSMTGATLGKWGKNICWVTYLFLFYSLLVAYISGSGSLFSSFFKSFGTESPGASSSLNFPIWLCSLFFVLLFGWVVYLGTRRVDHVNRVLMFVKIGFFILLIAVASQFLRPALLLRAEPKYAVSALPLLVIAFGFHNMIPSLTAYLNGDLKRVRLTILGGSLFAFLIYLIWEILVLGLVPFRGPHGLLASLMNDQEASQAIAALTQAPAILIFSQGLAFFAILTSFLAQALSLVHFLADGCGYTRRFCEPSQCGAGEVALGTNRPSYKKQETLWLCLLALAPPLILSLIYPRLFFKALNFAGGICAVILFGILPVLMVWIGRYRNQAKSTYEVPGGKITLIGVLLIAILIFVLQLSSMFGLHLFPDPHSLY